MRPCAPSLSCFPLPSFPFPRQQYQHTQCLAYLALHRSRPSNHHSHSFIRARSFHDTSTLYDTSKSRTHYEILEVSPTATARDIKRQFYHLSKLHHPDHNRNDPTSTSRYANITTAYRTLSDPNTRFTYDRTLPASSFSKSTNIPRGSYSSAGGRTPSGLSKRRATFRGPPPSFFQNGGYGGYTGRAANAGGNSTANQGAGRTTFDHNHNSGEHGLGGDTGFNPEDAETPHFDRAGHTRTHERVFETHAASRLRRGVHTGEDESRSRRGRAANAEFATGTVSGSGYVHGYGASAAWAAGATSTSRDSGAGTSSRTGWSNGGGAYSSQTGRRGYYQRDPGYGQGQMDIFVNFVVVSGILAVGILTAVWLGGGSFGGGTGTGTGNYSNRRVMPAAPGKNREMDKWKAD